MVKILLSFLISCLASRALAEPFVYKIGAILPLSGPVAFAGEDIRKGLELAAETTRDIKFEFQYEDSQLNGKRAANAANLFTTQRKVDLIISLWDTAEPVAAIAERAKVPHISIRWNPHVADKFYYTFTVESTYKSYVLAQLKLLQKLGIKTVAMISQESEGWGLAYRFFQDNAPQYGIQVVSAQEYVPDTQDFKSIITKALSKKPEYILLNSFVPDTQTLVTRINEAAPGQKILGYFDGDDAKPLFEGRPYVSQYAPAPWFEKMFTDRYHDTIKTRAPQAYDIIKVIALLHKDRTQKLSANEFVEALKKLDNFPGASGTLSTHGGKTIESECAYSIVKEGKTIRYQLPE